MPQTGDWLGGLLPSRYLLRTLAVVTLFIVLFSTMPWIGHMLARVLGSPDLRHTVHEQARTAEGHRSYRLTVLNMGMQQAENVYVNIRTRAGEIISYEVDSQELYEVASADLEHRSIGLTVGRLAPGAAIAAQLITTPEDNVGVTITATDQYGVSRPIDDTTLSRQMESYSARVRRIFTDAWGVITRRLDLDALESYATRSPFVRAVYDVLKSEDFQKVGLAALIVVLLIAAFFPEQSRLPIALIFASFVALFFNPPVPLGLGAAVVGTFIGMSLLRLLRESNGSAVAALLALDVLFTLMLMLVAYDTLVPGRLILAGVAFIIAILVTPVPHHNTRSA